MDVQELEKIVVEHVLWLECESDGKRADLSGANLRGMDLHRANLRRANLRRADLHGADLRGADLHGTNLPEADLRGADLRMTYLCGTCLCSANLFGADLREAVLRTADLRGTNLHEADLRGADLRWADLRVADLRWCRYDLLGILGINMGALPDSLTLELMRQDAQHCGIEAMDAWVGGGDCPFVGAKERPFLFNEKRALWPIGEDNQPELNIVQLWRAVARELKIKL